MRYLSRLALVAVFLLFAFAVTRSVTTMVSLTEAVATAARSEDQRSTHIAVYLPDQATLFFDDLKRGVESVAADYDLAVSYHRIGQNSPEFHMARYSGIDGAIIYPYLPEEKMRQELEALDAQGIPVVLVEQDVADNWPWTFVGTNNFEMGRRIGTRLAERGVHDQVIVIYSDKSPAVAAERELIELGIVTSMGDRLASPISRRQTGLNPLHAEAVTYQLLGPASSSGVTALVFTDTDDTLAALQAIINLNLVGQVQVIGFGVTDAILEYLNRGVLDATVAVNPQRIGIEAVRVLSELMRTGNAPGYVDTGVEVIRGKL